MKLIEIQNQGGGITKILKSPRPEKKNYIFFNLEEGGRCI